MHDIDAEIRESILINHIRHLLLNYVVQHITADYIQLTEQAVVDLWATYFVEIPTTDPNSLILPSDPFDTLTRIYGLAALERFQEKLQCTPGAIQHIKRFIKVDAGKLKSERVALQESRFESNVPLCRPFSPILTTRARPETPRPKANPKLFDFLPALHQEFLSSQKIAPVEVEPISETVVKQDEVLNTNWRLRPEEHDAVRSLLRSTLTGPPKGYKNRHLIFSARPDSPPIPSRIPEPQFIPIFPRRRRVGSGVREGDPPPSGLKSIANLPAVILPPVEIDEEPGITSAEYDAYRSSPSPTPSPSSSQEDQIDELFMESPDTTPPPVRPTKMEIVEIPRVRRIGGERNKPLPIGHGTDLWTFLQPHATKVPTASPPSHLSLEPSLSMVGQADSACHSTLDIDPQDLDGELAGLYGHRKQDPRDLILKEKLDEKRQLLMDVPVLPPPNEHPPNALFLPSSLADFVVPVKDKGQTNVKHPAHMFLKKAKGIPSLNVELSWVPIAAKTRIPTSSEIIKVTGLFDTDLPTLYPELDEPDPEISRCEIILSRKERRRVGGLPDEVQDEEMEMEDTYDPLDPEDLPIDDDRSAKRPKRNCGKYFDDSGIALDLQGGQTFLGEADSYLYEGDKGNLLPHDETYYDYDAFDTPPAEYNGQHDAYSQTTAFPAEFQRSPDDLGVQSISEPRDFVALSFESLPISAQPTQLLVSLDETANTSAQIPDNPNAIVTDSRTTEPSVHPPSPDIASHSLGIEAFARLRAKKITVPVPKSLPAIMIQDASARLEEPSHSVPENIYDRNTVRLPCPWNPPGLLHRYMVSMDLVQKQGLVRCLRSRSCCIDLVERDSLGGVDIILDPHTSILFTNLLILPSECVNLVNRIAQQSWLYSRLLVIFEAYPTAYSYRSKGGTCNMASELFAYSPPVLKALGKLRRDLGIAEGCGSKRPACAVQYAFADTVEEAAMFTRYFGDFAEANDDSRGMIWGDRPWLDDDVPEGEQDLAAADGMNRFAAYLILCQIDLGDFLELSAEARMEKFGAFVGVDRMILLNQVIERRLQEMQPSDSEMEPSVVASTVQSQRWI
ncbi:hypothetical protein MSAN_01270000 [Mycena sanguinolenta]|uniref:Uncharacterized protein n=1 Tax=Mycena sanguinolenta TaxID=230812 RepID=A0A8H7D548_9AGAR|nr:hypothetical protein MSAN_01270000 [Mycena sanguinolenta]